MGLTVPLLPLEGPGGKNRQRGEKHARNQGTRRAILPVRRAPSEPRGGDGEQENGSERAEHQRTEDHAEPAPAAWRMPSRWLAPIVRHETRDPPAVGEDMDG